MDLKHAAMCLWSRLGGRAGGVPDLLKMRLWNALNKVWAELDPSDFKKAISASTRQDALLEYLCHAAQPLYIVAMAIRAQRIKAQSQDRGGRLLQLEPLAIFPSQ